DRVRWQLEGVAAEHPDDTRAGITAVRITPTQTDPAAGHGPALFGQGREERLHHDVSRVQALLGHRGVLTGTVVGGRLLSDRQQFTAWGDRVIASRPPERPWPGQLPPPLPSEVFTPARPVSVSGEAGASIQIDERGILSTRPA